MNVPVEKIKQFEGEYIDFLHNKHQDVLDALEDVAKELSSKY